MVYHCITTTYQVTLDAKKIVTQVEALEIAMKLEASLFGNTHAGVQQIQSQLADLTLKL